MGRVEERAGVPVPGRVRLLEADMDRGDARHKAHVAETAERFEELTDELRQGRESNNKLLTAILVAIIVALITQVVMVRLLG